MGNGTVVVECNDEDAGARKSPSSLGRENDAGHHDIEDVYKLIGFGRVQWLVLLVGGLYLLLVINETLGMSTVTLASQCDFGTNSVKKAILNSASFMGIVCASYFWGYLSDVVGRRSILIWTTFSANLLSLSCMFLPSFWPFVIVRILVGVFIAGASSPVYAYLGEFFTAFYRPIVINYASLFIGIGMVYFPAVSWLIMTMDWSIPITAEFNFRPWRLIMLFYLLPGFIASCILLFLPESPRFFLSVNRQDDAYKALDWVCRHTKGETLADLKVFKLKTEMKAQNENILITSKSFNIITKMWQDTLPLFRRPHITNLLISSTVMMGLFMSCSGMGLWYPTIQNRVGLTDQSSELQTVCQILETYHSTQQKNTTTADFCFDIFTKKSFIDSLTIGASYIIGFLILGVVINPLGRKGLMIGALTLSGCFGTALLWIQDPTAIIVSFVIFLVLPGITISVLSSGVVDLMPTYLRGKAVCITLMLGRAGSVIGSNIIGALLETHCAVTFGFFGGFGLLCAILMLFLPI